jgi:RNA polymerase sigma factor (sigma-70 family)
MTLQAIVDKATPAGTNLLADEQLLQACRDGEEQAWLQLLHKYERLVYSIPLNYGLAQDDAADITQSVFTAFLQNLPTLHDQSNLGAWLTTVARRQSWRVLQRQRREQSQGLDIEQLKALLVDETGEIEHWELTEILHRTLALLGERCQVLLIALYLEAKTPSYAELAQRLNLAEGSIGPTRARCLQCLKQLLTC